MCSLCKKKSYSSYLNEMVIKQAINLKTKLSRQTEKTETYSDLSNTINETFNIDTENVPLCKSIAKKKLQNIFNIKFLKKKSIFRTAKNK